VIEPGDGKPYNRCPRGITEGLATWEEENHNASWTRNMRRDLLDAWWNKDLIRVRDLYRAFRSSRILFGYFMSGQLCRMLIEEQGFAPMVKLLEAFDRGDDLDQAIGGTFGMTPEQLDARFDAWVQRAIEPLRIEPRWSAGRTTALKFELDDKPPKEAEAARRWADGWTSVAWGYFQQGRKVDAEQALRKLALVGELPPRALFLQGAVAAERNDNVTAKELYERGLAAGVRTTASASCSARWPRRMRTSKRRRSSTSRRNAPIRVSPRRSWRRSCASRSCTSARTARTSVSRRSSAGSAGNPTTTACACASPSTTRRPGATNVRSSSTCSRTRSIRSGASCTATGRRAWSSSDATPRPRASGA
jgi:hypothetical protein